MNVTFVGMPGSGKSYVGKKLAEHLGYTFIETDKLIEEAHGLPLQQVLEKLGEKAFLKTEEETILAAIKGKKKFVLSPGGSVIYSERVMKALQKASTVVYLTCSLPVLEARIGGIPRGIVGSDAKTLEELYIERAPLYKQYADLAIRGELEPQVEHMARLIKFVS